MNSSRTFCDDRSSTDVSLRGRICSMSIASVLSAVIVVTLHTPGASAVIGGVPDRTTSDIVVGLAPFNKLGSPYCSGTLVDSNWVLTAAHCVTNDDGSLGSWLSSSVVGTSSGLNGDSSRRSSIRAVAVHPNYRGSATGADIALIKVDSNFGGARAALASTADVSAIESIFGVATTVGFGRVSQAGPTSSTALEVTTTLWPPSECRRQWPYTGSSHRDDFICSQGTLSRTVCNGDSGGPLFITLDNQRLLAGVLSFGSARACGYSFNVHARVTSFQAFLDSYGIGKVTPVVPELPPLPTSPEGVIPELPALPVFQAATAPVLPKFTTSRAYQLVLSNAGQGCLVYIDGQLGQRGLRIRLFTQRTGGSPVASRILDEYGDATLRSGASCANLRRTGIYIQLASGGPRSQAVE